MGTLSWPPKLSEEQLASLTRLATTWALSHGLLYLPPTDGAQPPAPTSAIHAPLALFPSPFPRPLFLLAQRLQRTYDELYARVAMDTEFLDRVMGAEEGAGKVDEFTGQLWKGWRALRDQGQERRLHLGLFRSDYLVHAPSPDEPPSLKQVEFNTISSSFGTLSDRAAAMHKYLLASTGYYDSSPHLKTENMPANSTTAGLAGGLAAAHAAYGVPGSFILFVVQDGERNVFDQRWLEYELLETHAIHIVRQTLDELASSASVDATTGALTLTLPNTLSRTPTLEISTIYFRAGYTPTDYPTPRHYATRFLLERARATSCPSIPLQLAGGKKVQQVLARPGVLERFLAGADRADARAALRASWMEMWALDDDDDVGGGVPGEGARAESAGVRAARARHAALVLKPQREGGGNNVYGADIPPFLDGLPVQEREAWIAMETIAGPCGLRNWLVRAGVGGTSRFVQEEIVSELGIFGTMLFRERGDAPVEVLADKEAGYLLRTKEIVNNEGGVGVGFSVLDSVVLVDG